MKVEHINPFILAGMDALDQLMGGGAEPGHTAMRSALYTTEQISIAVGVTGDITGQVIYGMSQVTATIIASAMFEERHVAFNAAAESAISELANIISGHAATMLNEAGLECDITPARLIRGAGVEVARVPALVYSFYSKSGKVDVSIAITESAHARTLASVAG